MAQIDDKLEGVFSDVVRRNAGETEFHQAVREVLESLGRVVAKHPEYLDKALMPASVSPNVRSSFVFPGQMTKMKFTSTAASGCSSTRRWGRTKVACAFTRR